MNLTSTLIRILEINEVYGTDRKIKLDVTLEQKDKVTIIEGEQIRFNMNYDERKNSFRPLSAVMNEFPYDELNQICEENLF